MQATEQFDIDKFIKENTPLVSFGPLPEKVVFAIKLKNLGIRGDMFAAAMKQFEKTLEN